MMAVYERVWADWQEICMRSEDFSGNDVADRFVRALRIGGTAALAEAFGRVFTEWLEARDLPADPYNDVFYVPWLPHYDQRPQAVAIVMTIESYELLRLLEYDLDPQWYEFVESLGFSVTRWDHMTYWFYPESDGLKDAIVDQLNFEWSAKLVAPDVAAVYNEIFEYFASRPERMHDLHHRAFEEMLSSVFLAQGYQTTLGPGSGDEGVDVRLTENTVYGESVTVVQAKRYKNPIELHWVASLLGVAYDQKANRGLFVTTSRYLPGAQRFATRQEGIRIDLATSKDVAEWCDAIAARKSESEWLRQKAPYFRLDPSKILVASVGVGISDNRFACVVAETPSAARLVILNKHEEWTGASSTGYHTPDLTTALESADSVTARRRPDASYWDRKPCWYDLND
jgi:Restriction endonuclease